MNYIYLTLNPAMVGCPQQYTYIIYALGAFSIKRMSKAGNIY